MIETKAAGVNERARMALNVLAVRAVEAAQTVNSAPQQVDTGRLARALDAIEARAADVRRELGR
jgi:hypothetical protein